MSSTVRRRPRRTVARAAILVIAALVLSGCTNGSDESADPPAPTAEVDIETFIFSPDPLEVAAGTEVSFDNLDSTTHTVTAGTRDEPGGDFDASLDEGESFVHVFDEPGTYEYFCALHSGEGMTGVVVVE